MQFFPFFLNARARLMTLTKMERSDVAVGQEQKKEHSINWKHFWITMYIILQKITKPIAHKNIMIYKYNNIANLIVWTYSYIYHPNMNWHSKIPWCLLRWLLTMIKTNHVATKLNQDIDILSKLRSRASLKILKMAYHSLFCSHLLYGSQPWGSIKYN